MLQMFYNGEFQFKYVEKLNELVLAFDANTKTPLISVDEQLVKELMPHQAKGVKFMWDACFGSVDKITERDMPNEG